MSMKTFFVKYANEARQIIHSDIESIEAFCNMHFGSAWEHAKEFGAHISMTEHDMAASLTDGAYEHLFHPAGETQQVQQQQQPVAPSLQPPVQNTQPLRAPEAPTPVDPAAQAPSAPVAEPAPQPVPTTAPPAETAATGSSDSSAGTSEAPVQSDAAAAQTGGDVTLTLTGAESATATGGPTGAA